MVQIATVLQIGSCLTGAAASALWFKACFVVVPYVPVEQDGWFAAAVTIVKGGKAIDLDASAERAKVWNAWAAAITGLAALMQVASTLASAAVGSCSS